MLSVINGNNYIIAIGASAGGLDSITHFFDNVPGNTGIAYIIIQHLSPDHKSMMAEILSKHTSMPVFEATEDLPVQPDQVYLIPTKKLLTIKDGKLKLQEKTRTNVPNTAIDIFFDSLAREKGNKSVAIVMSGTGTDGTRGIESIKKAGGTVVVQDPYTAEFNGMPQSAIDSGFVDLILPPEIMPENLFEFLKEAPLIQSLNVLDEEEEKRITGILHKILQETSHDFSDYKRPTIIRRLSKRMAEKRIKSLEDYYAYINESKEEARHLYNEFLINVTSFFRDEEAFETIQKKVIPEIIQQSTPGESIKVWVIAASTGQEAYSLAILFDEYLIANSLEYIQIKIFATDIDEDAILIASKGLYTEADIGVLSAERIQTYFRKEGTLYRVTPALRKMIVFARHDITKDPPYSKIDFLTCRNMLIYMNQSLQRSILLKIHFAINENGFLFFGASENIGILKNVVKEVDRKWKIYQCVSKTKVSEETRTYIPYGRKFEMPVTPTHKKSLINSLQEIFTETLLEEQKYAGILIDNEYEVKQAIGNFKKYIRFADNVLNFHLLKLVNTDLSLVLSTSIHKVLKDNKKMVLPRVKISENGKDYYLNIIIKPILQQKPFFPNYILILISEVECEEKLQKIIDPTKNPVSSDLIIDLETELKETKENLQAVLEEMESANEELQASNEEILSSNEELQSTNEELQSLNEELHTVNTEHQLKIKELFELNEDLNNYFNNTDIGQVLVDRHLIIRRFTPVITRQLNVIETDIGRLITDISNNLKGIEFINQIKLVMKTGNPIVKEVSMDDDQVYLMRIAPYVKNDNTIDGVVISFTNILETKKLSEILDAVFNSSTSGITAKKAIRDESGEIIDFEYLTGNRVAEKILNIPHLELAGKKMKELLPTFDMNHFNRYVDIVTTGETDEFEYFEPLTGRWYNMICVKLMDGVVTTSTDITEKKEAEIMLEKGYQSLQQTSNQLKVSNYQLEKSNFDLMQFASVASHDLKEPLRKIQAFGSLLKEKVKTKLDSKEENYLAKVINAASRMQALVDDILALSKLSDNDINQSPVSLVKIIDQIKDDLEISIQEKNAKIITSPLPIIMAVPGQMHQLFLNLIANALKFNEDSSPVISITEKPVNPEHIANFNLKNPERHVCIEVEDNGIGFDEIYAEKIFGIFQRLSGNQYTGTGIGLAICKKIIDNHHGYIRANSVVDEGTKFTIILPKKRLEKS